jgi:capsular polysaccharide biosynthesis protein
VDRPPQSDFLFVGRRDVKKRFLLGQREFGEQLERKHGARTYFPEDHALQASIAHFADAQQIVLPVGSAKFNLTFCEPGTKVVCITPRGYAAENGAIVQTVRHICDSLHLRLAFYGVAVQGQANHAINRDMVLAPEDIDPIVRLIDSL